MAEQNFNSDTPVPKEERIRAVSKGVNLKTFEGARLSFDSLEEMDAYLEALIAEDYDNEI
jgi:hypothetical protein